MTLQNVALLADEILELFFVTNFGVVRDSDEGQQVLVYRARVDSREITPDNSFTFEALYPRVNGRRGETEPLPNSGVCNPGIVLN